MIRSLNKTEQELVTSMLKVAGSGQSVPMEDFLKANYFTERNGRALIIQVDGKYAVLYLKNELYDNEQLRTREINAFYELVAFLEYLNSNGYITIYKNVTEKMYFIQDGFNAVKVINDTIALNIRGDYTSKPDAIHDSNNNVIYKGILFRSEQYYLILGYACGSFIVSDRIQELLSVGQQPTPAPAFSQPVQAAPSINDMHQRNNPPSLNQTDASNQVAWPTSQEKPESPQSDQKRNKFQWALLILNLLFTAGLLGMFLFLYQQNRAHQTAVNQLYTHHAAWKDSLAQQNTKISNLLSQASAPSKEEAPLIQIEEAIKKHYGVDVSHHNGDMVSRLTSHDSITFVICKATEGLTYVDPYLPVNWNLIKEKDLLLGVYHFYKTYDDPIRQAEFFLSHVEKHGQPDLPLVIDIENGSLPKQNGSAVSISRIQADLLKCLQHLEQKSGKKPMLYTGRSFANKYLNNKSFGEYPLWLADYRSSPRTPSAWAATGYHIWQKTSSYPIEHTHADFDVFHGRLSELLQ